MATDSPGQHAPGYPLHALVAQLRWQVTLQAARRIDQPALVDILQDAANTIEGFGPEMAKLQEQVRHALEQAGALRGVLHLVAAERDQLTVVLRETEKLHAAALEDRDKWRAQWRVGCALHGERWDQPLDYAQRPHPLTDSFDRIVVDYRKRIDDFDNAMEQYRRAHGLDRLQL